MNPHHLIAVASALTLFGLVGFAEASNFARPAKKTNELRELRPLIKAAAIPGCNAAGP
jgi:hypothetical protein